MEYYRATTKTGRLGLRSVDADAARLTTTLRRALTMLADTGMDGCPMSILTASFKVATISRLVLPSE